MQQANNTPLGHNNPPSDAESLQLKLRDDHNKPLTRAQELVEASARIPAEILDEDMAGKATDFIKQVTGCKKTLESLRVSEKEPYLNLGRVVDGFFKNVSDTLTGAESKARKPLDTFMKRKADAERREREERAREERRIAEEKALTATALEKAQLPDAAADMLDQTIQAETTAHKAEVAAVARPSELAKSRGTSGALASLRTLWTGEVVDVQTLDLEVLRTHINPEALQKAVNSFVAAGGRTLRGASIFEKSETVVR